MFTIKNALKNIYRYKNKYILFGILYLILILAASVSVTMFVHMGKTLDNLSREYCSVVRFKEFLTEERPQKDEYLKYKNMENISDMKFFKYSFSTNHLKENISELQVEVHFDGRIKSLDYLLYDSTFVLGYNTSLLHLAADEFNLEKGRMFENDDECVIAKNSKSHKDSSAWNFLDLGDKIVIKNNDDIYKEFTIVGIQKENSEDDINTTRRMIYTTLESAEYFDNIASALRGNYITAPENTVDIGDRNFNFSSNNPQVSIKMGYDVVIYLDSPEKFEELRAEMRSVSGDLYGIEPAFENFRTIWQLIYSIQASGIGFIIITAFIIICITIISTIILLNSRKYEIAVLRSAGMSKTKLIISYLVENLVFIWSISIISLTAAQFIAPLFSNKVLENMREFMSAESFANITNGINCYATIQNIGIVFAGATAVVMLSLILACVNIVRFEPLKIFNKQY